MAINWKSLLAGLSPVLSMVVGAVASGKLSKYNTLAQTAVKSAVTKVDNGVDQLQSAYTSYSTANPVVAEAITEFTQLLTTAGIELPSADVIETHIKAAIADLAGIIAPSAGAATTVAAS